MESIIVPKMPRRATASRRLLIVLLVLCAVVSAQAASFVSDYYHNHSTRHCCGLCHTGPLPLIQPTVTAAFAPVLSMAWMERFARANTAYQVLLAAGHTRAPPA